MRRWAPLFIAITVAGCGTPTVSVAPASVAPRITAAPTVTWLPTPSANSDSTATSFAAPALVSGVRFPPTAWGKPWRILGGKYDPSDPYKAIEGIRPPDGVYVLEWMITGMPCSGLLTNGLDTWSFGPRALEQRGLALADLVDAADNPYQMFAPGCDGWVVAIRPVKTYFGPNSIQVARLVIRADELGPDWELVAGEEVSAEALAIEALVLDAGKRDPNLGAALHNARAASWEFNNNYLNDHPAAATLRRLAITAEVAQPLLPAREFDILYGPMATYIDPLELGLPTHR